ncbi:hypothetical protein I656_00359 [Geobacillus sp. WSUCF1]|nr:hypothetical protein I656_00359 [Geobacillus sp. WSUCF1]
MVRRTVSALHDSDESRCADVEKLAAWGRQYGLKEEWIDRRGEFPHFDLLGETQTRILQQEGRLFELERFTKRGKKE